MLDIKWLRENLEEAGRRLATRGEEAPLARLEELDAGRRDLLKDVEALKSTRNRVSEEIGLMKRQGQDAAGPIAEMRRVGDQIRELEKKLSGLEEELQALLMRIPNLPSGTVPVGSDSEDNVEVRAVGDRPVFPVCPEEPLGPG